MDSRETKIRRAFELIKQLSTDELTIILKITSEDLSEQQLRETLEGLPTTKKQRLRELFYSLKR